MLTSQIRIRVGEYDFSSVQEELPYVERGVAKKLVHPKYNFFTYEYDLALVKLDKPLEFAPHISPICLPASDDLLIGENATVTGWGRLSEKGTLPSVLQEVSLLSNYNYTSTYIYVILISHLLTYSHRCYCSNVVTYHTYVNNIEYSNSRTRYFVKQEYPSIHIHFVNILLRIHILIRWLAWMRFMQIHLPEPLFHSVYLLTKYVYDKTSRLCIFIYTMSILFIKRNENKKKHIKTKFVTNETFFMNTIFYRR